MGIDNMEFLSARQWIERQQLATTVLLRLRNILFLPFCPKGTVFKFNIHVAEYQMN